MRLSTAPQRDEPLAIAVIHAALDAGATLLDTADAYCRDESDVGHNERLVAHALERWTGDRSTITIATKGGMRRPNGAWVSDGRAKHLRDACDASRRALGTDVIDLYQLHAVDQRTPFETSVRALAGLRNEGKIRRIGLCNVTVGQIAAAAAITEISSVQVEWSVLDDESLRNGVAEYCRDRGIRLIAYRPLGGDRVKRLARDPVLRRIAAKHEATGEEIALAWLMSFDADVVPIPGATRVATARSLSRALELELDEDERAQLDERYSGRLLRVPRARRRPPDAADGEVVLVMGMPGAGKTTATRELEERGYERLNRDTLGGSLTDLVTRLDATLDAGNRRVVLDNTYATRKSRNEVIECAWLHGVPVRCVWLATDLADAQVNAIVRMIDAHGRLPTPEEIRERGKHDPRYLLPAAQFQYERVLEPPLSDEGFTAVERRAFVRASARETGASPARALILDFDDLLVQHDDGQVVRADDVRIADTCRDVLARYTADGWLLFAHAWRPQIARGQVSAADVDASFARVRELLGLDIDLACCPHDAGPPICWCRKPLPGLVLEFAMRRGVALERSIIVGGSAADRTMAERLGVRLERTQSLF
jgi:aryl-alcohol dehydrogenase-like predicted oxidoreductase/histidinol phosphatase-like enzyme